MLLYEFRLETFKMQSVTTEPQTAKMCLWFKNCVIYGLKTCVWLTNGVFGVDLNKKVINEQVLLALSRLKG